MKRPKRKRIRSFDEIQAEWYLRLAMGGFHDIEAPLESESGRRSDADRPLKEWHSRKFKLDRSRIRQEQRERYNERIDSFMNREDIDEICELIVDHGNSVLSKAKVKKVLELHRGGLTERKIAEKIKRSKKCVHLTLKKAREWMKVA